MTTTDFNVVLEEIGWALLKAPTVEVPTWQSLDVTNKPQGKTVEIIGSTFAYEIPATIEGLQQDVQPNLPWAENHFLERVSGIPHNPPPSHSEWPWARHNAEHQQDEKFSHTYPERYWPKTLRQVKGEGRDPFVMGLRYAYGDLNDVVNMLAEEPMTRQAYLPVFFPEDTGAVHKQRIPCSLGYQFLLRANQFHVIYGIRSCDFYRHFRDDVYMTCRLVQWVLEKLKEEPERLAWDEATIGKLVMNMGSLHIFEGDMPKLEREYGPSK